ASAPPSSWWSTASTTTRRSSAVATARRARDAIFRCSPICTSPGGFASTSSSPTAIRWETSTARCTTWRRDASRAASSTSAHTEERAMGRFGNHVIDADGHGGDLPNWQSRIPAAFQPNWEERRERIKKQFANLPGVGIKETKGTAKLNSLDRPGMTDPKARLEDMDLEGIDQTIMFPGGAGEE